MTLEDYLAMDNVCPRSGDDTMLVKLDDTDNGNDREVSPEAWGALLAGVLRRAARQKRLTCGLAGAARALELRPASVRLCVLALPSNTKGGGAGGLPHLHSVLLEAHCYEHGIPCVKVDSADKLASLVGPDSNCVLVHSAPLCRHKHNNNIIHHNSIPKEPQEISESALLASASGAPHVLVLPVSPPP